MKILSHNSDALGPRHLPWDRARPPAKERGVLRLAGVSGLPSVKGFRVFRVLRVSGLGLGLPEKSAAVVGRGSFLKGGSARFGDLTGNPSIVEFPCRFFRV